MDIADKTRSTVAANVQRLMTDRGIKADALAKQIGVGYSSLYRILRKEQNATAEMLAKLGIGLGVPAWVFMLEGGPSVVEAAALDRLVKRFQGLSLANKELAVNMISALSGDNTLAAPSPSDKARNTAA